MSCWFLPYNAQIRMHISIPSLWNLSPTYPHPIPSGHHRAPDWAPCVKQQLPKNNNNKKNPSSPLAILRVVVYICQRFSSGSPSLLPISVPTRVPSMSASLFLPCKQVPQYHFSRFHINELIYGVCFSLFDFTLQETLSSSTSF